MEALKLIVGGIVVYFIMPYVIIFFLIMGGCEAACRYITPTLPPMPEESWKRWVYMDGPQCLSEHLKENTSGSLRIGNRLKSCMKSLENKSAEYPPNCRWAYEEVVNCDLEEVVNCDLRKE